MNAEECSCTRPLEEKTRHCLRCGHELPVGKPALSAQAQAMAETIAFLAADRVIEILEAKQSRQKPSKYATRQPVQLEFE